MAVSPTRPEPGSRKTSTRAPDYSYRQYDWVGGTNPTDAQLKDPANWAFVSEQSAASTPMNFDPNIHPNRLDKFLVEFDRQLSANWGSDPARDLFQIQGPPG